jgi:hypothetical protein
MNPNDLFTLIERIHFGWNGTQRFLEIWAPVTAAPNLIAPFLAIASVLSVALLSGVAIAALSTLIIALAALHILLTQVLGLSIEIN